MAAPLTIRNLTSTAVELQLLERFEAPKKGLAHIKRSFTILRSHSEHASAQLAASAASFSHQDVSIRVEAFATAKTELKAVENSTSETLRLTFKNDGERYRLDIQNAAYECVDLIPLTPTPRFKYTAIYLPEASHLVLFSSANLQAWMLELDDETPISGLSIPGTHNSPAYHRALPSVRCQAVSPKEQLENGVRFFDIRVQIEKPGDPAREDLILVHSVFPVSLTGTKYFRQLVNDVFEFLETHPSETLIMTVKREGTGDGTDEQLGRILRDHYAGDVNKWFTAPRIPTLGDARKKIVLIRRFGLEDGLKHEWGGAGWCIDASSWADNTPDGLCPSGDLRIQDFYEVLETENIDKKIEFAEAHLARASEAVCVLPGVGAQNADGTSSPKQPIFINFLSASNFWKVGCWPEKIAAKLNPSVIDYLCRKHNEPAEGKPPGDGCTGIVVCDWVGNNGNWDLVRAVVGMNAKLESREKKT